LAKFVILANKLLYLSNGTRQGLGYY